MDRRTAFFVTIALAAVCAVTAWRIRGPAPATGSKGFSAPAAFAILSDLLREGVPHPVGSAANKRVRDGIVTRLAADGYATEVQRSFVCNAAPACADVENIVATPRSPAELVFLAAHYDSVPEGPGASDDGVGVAVLLEIASMLKAADNIGFIITDGEEAGLLGAEAFVRERRNLARMRAVVNVENRGTSGPSILFETSRNNEALIAAAARSIPQPSATSLSPAIYELLPNDTDLTVFKRAGEDGLNFAAIKGVDFYHTPLDDLAHVNLRTLQHHGDSALAAARALAAQSSLRSEQNAVYFDVLGLGVVRWPAHWTPFLIALSLIILIAGGWPVSWRGWGSGIIYFVVTAVLALALGSIALFWPRPIAAPPFAIATMWLAGILSALIAALVVRRKDARVAFVGCAIAWHFVALIVAVKLPGASFLFAFPAFVMAIAVLARLNVTLRATLAATAAALVMFTLAQLFYVSLGAMGLVLTSILLGFAGTTFGQALGIKPRAVVAIAAAFVVCAAVMFALPRQSATAGKLYALENNVVKATAVRNGNRVTLSLESQRDADVINAAFAPAVRVISVNGVAPAPLNPRRAARPPYVTIHGRKAIVELEAAGPVEVTASDYSYRREPGARVLRTRRDRGAIDVTRTETVLRF